MVVDVEHYKHVYPHLFICRLKLHEQYWDECTSLKTQVRKSELFFKYKIVIYFIDLKLSPCSERCMLSSG